MLFPKFLVLQELRLRTQILSEELRDLENGLISIGIWTPENKRIEEAEQLVLKGSSQAHYK
ncbi:MAG: hypothetical protein QW769_09295 [Nitrososphaerales archaeon]